MNRTLQAGDNLKLPADKYIHFAGGWRVSGAITLISPSSVQGSTALPSPTNTWWCCPIGLNAIQFQCEEEALLLLEKM